LKAKEAYQDLVKALKDTYSEREANNISKILFEDLYGMFFLGKNEEMSSDEYKEFETALHRLKAGEPIQYVTGIADFFGFKFKVNNNVLIPRPETEQLVDLILRNHKEDEQLKALDIGTGSGCIPISIKKHKPAWNISAIDISSSALEVANGNAQMNDVDINFQQMNFLNCADWPFDSKYDIIISNPPYIPKNEKHLIRGNVIDHEPHIALFVEDEDPLIFYERILDFSSTRLSKDGNVYLECNEYLSKELILLIESKEWIKDFSIEYDLQNKFRIIQVKRA